jgi:hypothetical protein
VISVKGSAALLRIGAFLTLGASVARAQAGTGTWGFVNVRYDTRSSAAIYSGYGWRGAFAMAGVLNTRSGYAEVLGGVGAAFRTGPNANHWLAIAGAQPGAVWSAQVYWLRTVRTCVVSTRATVKWSVPYEGSTVRKLSIAPLAVTRPLVKGLAGGMAMDLTAANGARTSISTGLQLRLRLPRAALNADLLRDVTGKDTRLRMFFASLF